MRLTRLLPVLLILLVLAGGAILAFANLASPAQLAAALQTAARDATGRALTIAGPVQLTAGLSPHLRAETLSLANPDGASRPAMATAARLDADLALLPLLTGQIVLEHLTLTGLDAKLERLPDGTPNWRFPTARNPLYGGGGGGANAAADLHDIVAEGGRLTYVPAPSGLIATPTLSLPFDRLRWSAESQTALQRVALRGTQGGVDYTVKIEAGSLDRLGGGPVAALSGSWPLTIDAAAAGATLHIEGGFVHPDEARAYDFRATANVPELEALQPLIPGTKLLPLREVNFTTRLTDGSTGVLRTEGLSLHAAAADLTQAVPGLLLKEAVLSAPGPGQLAQFDIDGTYQGAALRLSGTATQPDVLSLAAPIQVALAATAGEANFSARGTIPSSLGGQGLDLTVSARAPELEALSPLLGRNLPAAHDLTFDAKLGDAGFRLRGVALRNLRLASSIGDLSGNVTAAWSPVLDLNGTLQSSNFDIDALGLSLHRDTPEPMPGAEPVSQPKLFSDKKLPFALLRGADSDLTVTAAQLKAGGDHYRDVQFTLASHEGRLTLNPLRLTAPQGLIVGGLTIDASGETPAVAASLRSPALSAAALTALFGSEADASGTMQIDAQLSGTGQSPAALAASLGGHVGIAMVNGRISDTLIQSWLGNALAASGIPPLTEGDTDVACLALRADFRNGTGTLRTLALDSPQLTLQGSGQFNLADETVNLHLRPQAVTGGTTLASPVAITGTFQDPHAALDAAMPGGRYGITIGGRANRSCVSALSLARNGLPGPVPSIALPTPNVPQPGAKRPVDLLQGIIH